MESRGNRKLIVDLLNADLQGEHGAIIQYLYHAWTLDLPGISSTLEGISRDEMYHFQWLAQHITELGGEPSIQRAPVLFEAPTFGELMLLNSSTEDDAIAQYQAHIAEIDDEATVKMLERIISDEQGHAEQFKALAAEVEERAAEIEAAEEGERSPEAEAKRQRLLDMLNAGVRHEYSVVLQYLHQAYTTEDARLGHSLEQSAIVEMKHMGWLAEHVAEMGGDPEVERNKLVLADNIEDMLKANIADEEKAMTLYDEQIDEIDDPEVKSLLAEIRYHEEYHEYEFRRWLQQAVKRREAAKRSGKPSAAGGSQFTVGSLIRGDSS